MVLIRFSRGNKNKLRTFQPQKWRKKNKNSQPQTKFTGSDRKKRVYVRKINICLIGGNICFEN